MAKREGLYRFQLLFQSDNRMMLQHFLTQLMPEINQLKEAKKVQWSIDVDPIDLY
jgi:primosomal protein N' (replication factor Y)